jgi:phage-related protein
MRSRCSRRRRLRLFRCCLSGFIGAGSWLYSTGVNIIQGLINGVGAMVGSAVSAVKNVGGQMLSGVESFLGIKSPSTRFDNEVGQTP